MASMRKFLTAAFGSRVTMWAFYVCLALCLVLTGWGLLRKVNEQATQLEVYHRESEAHEVHTVETRTNTKEYNDARVRTSEVLSAYPDLRDQPLPDDVADRLRKH